MERDDVRDRALVERQLGREPRAFGRVVARCPHGGPTATEQLPYANDGTPFPTTYYLTCRHLVAAVSRIEAGGGVERWSLAVRRSPELEESLAQATDQQRRIRRALAEDMDGPTPQERPDGGASLSLGIGGSSNPEQLKCLHAHVAFALAQPGYALGRAILADVSEQFPPVCCACESAAGHGKTGLPGRRQVR